VKRPKYERSLQAPSITLIEHYRSMLVNALLADLCIQVIAYKEGSLYRYKICNEAGDALIEGLDPMYANASDYRRIVLALTENANV